MDGRLGTPFQRGGDRGCDGEGEGVVCAAGWQSGRVEGGGREIWQASGRERDWAGHGPLRLDGEGEAGGAAGRDGLGRCAGGCEGEVGVGGWAGANGDDLRVGGARGEVGVSTVDGGEGVSPWEIEGTVKAANPVADSSVVEIWLPPSRRVTEPVGVPEVVLATLVVRVMEEPVDGGGAGSLRRDDGGGGIDGERGGGLMRWRSSLLRGRSVSR